MFWYLFQFEKVSDNTDWNYPEMAKEAGKLVFGSLFHVPNGFAY